MSTPKSVDLPIIGLDIEAFSARDLSGHGDLQKGVREAFDEACAELSLGISPEDRGDRGDGWLAIVRPPAEVPRLVADLPRELDAALRRHNESRNATGRIRVRMAIHRGPVTMLHESQQGRAIVEAARILNCQFGRELLRLNDQADLVVLISETIYFGSVAEKLRDLRPEDFTPFRIGADGASGPEKGAGIQGWARVIGHGRMPPTSRQPESTGRHDPGSRYIGTNSGTASLGDHSPATSYNFHGDPTS